MATEQIELVVNPRQALSALKEINAGIAGTEQTADGANAKLQASVDKVSQFIVQAQDKQAKSVLRHVEAIQKQTDAYLKSPIEKINAQRQREIELIQKSTLSLEQQAASIALVNQNMDKRIALETAASGAATANARQVNALFKAAETGSVNSNRAAAQLLLSFKSLQPVIAVAFSAFGAVALLGVIEQIGEATAKWLKEMREAPRRMQTEFEEMYNSTAKENDALELTNVKLANQIAKLEHKPQNLVKEALLETRKAADDLADSLEKDNDKLIKFLETNQHGFWGSFNGKAPTDELTSEAKKYGNTVLDLEYKQKSGAITPEEAIKQTNAAIAARRKQLEGGIKTTEADIARANWGHTTPLPIEESPFYDKLQFQKRALLMLAQEEKLSTNQAENGKLKGKLAGAEAGAKGANSILQLQEELEKKRATQLEGEQKINQEYEARENHLKALNEGGVKVVAQQIAVLEQMKKIDVENYKREQARLNSTAIFNANRSVTDAQTRSSYAISTATRKASGGAFGNDDINGEYNFAMGQAQSQFDLAAKHVQDLRQQKAAEGEIIRAQIDATSKFAIAAIEAEEKRRVALIDLEKEQRDEEKKAAQERIVNAQRLLDIQTQGSISDTHGAIQHQIRMRGILAGRGRGLGQQIAGVRQDQSDSDAAVIDRYNKIEETIATKRSQDELKLNEAVGKDKEYWQKQIDNLEQEHLKNVEDKRKSITEDRFAAEEKIAQLEMQQLEEIKSKTQGLLHTLFTNPKGFGAQFRNTVMDAALHPVEEKLSTTISTEIYKMLHHGIGPGEGTGKLADLKGVGMEKDAIKVFITNGTTGYGTSAPATSGGYTPASWARGGFSPAAFSQMFQNGGSTFSGTPHGEGTSESIDFGGGPVDLGGNTKMYGGEVGFSSAASTFKRIANGGFSKGPGGTASRTANFGSVLKNFKNTDWGLSSTTDENGKTVGAGRHGVAGAGIMMGGTYLAERGLLGQDRGTTKGIFEGAAGGAAIGFEYGGPLGAAIGGAIGAGIGIGEKIAGVESPQNEAKRLVKQIYHVNIDNSMADKIVGIAQSKYANHVSIAVRDPEVRKMLELYAAGTGQNMPQSASAPHAGSLSEQGGTLYQSATYQYGKAYSYQSGLPVAGGMATTMYPNGGNQPMSLSINIAGKGAGDFLAGSVVTPDYVNAQWGSAASSSNGRVNNSALIQNPGLVVA